MLDLGVIGDQTLGRRAVNLACPQARGRLNGLYTGLFFIGGSVGSAVAGVAWVEAGWTLVCVIGLGFVALALVLALLERSDHANADAGGNG
jgi:predicted MFS family arabinose efflux permease